MVTGHASVAMKPLSTAAFTGPSVIVAGFIVPFTLVFLGVTQKEASRRLQLRASRRSSSASR